MSHAEAELEVLLCGTMSEDERETWLRELRAAVPHVQWHGLAQARRRPEAIRAAVVANPAPASLQGWPNLGLIQSLWAGVERLLADATVPQDIPLARMVDPAMTQAMTQTVLWAVLALHRGFFTYAQHQTHARWQPHAQRRSDEVPLLVLGSGVMGSAATQALRGLGYPVTAWRRAEGAEALAVALATAQIVVNLLPLTPQTRALIDARFLAALPAGSALVNLARGGHVVETDLLSALDRDHLSHAILDVFATEPLPPDHPFWRHPRVTVLPHVAAHTDARSAAGVVADNLQRFATGRPLLHRVDRARGY